MQLSVEQNIRLLINDIYRYRNFVVAAFVVVSLATMVVGMMWPKSYTSSTSVFVEQKSIIQPLMQGAAAVNTDVKDQATIAREIIFTRKVMNQVLDLAGWTKNKPSEIEKEKIADRIKDNTTVRTVSANLIKIEYKDKDPERAFVTAKAFADLLLKEASGSQTTDSREAFEFIDKQVREYHEKLVRAEQQLKEFHSRNVDARPGTQGEVSKRLDGLQGRIEEARLALKEAEIRRKSLEQQLAGEAEVTVSITREGQYQTRIAELQAKRDALRLTYHDTYPDIVRINYQIEELKAAILEERRKREEVKEAARNEGRVYVDEGVRLNPLYQQLRQELSQTKTQIATLKTRLYESKKLLDEELERARRIHGGEAILAELTRDYEVNRDIYQDLLRRRESARVSMNIDREQRGLNMRIQEPAALPLRPSGLRFVHFLVGGLILGLIVPMGALYGISVVDPRVRMPSVIHEGAKIPVLAVVPHMATPIEMKLVFRNIMTLGIVLLATIGTIVTVAALKISGVI